LQEFTNWTIDTIREDKILSSWLEEKKYDWIPLVAKSIINIIDKQQSILIITDDERDWFGQYIMSNINAAKNCRPLLPFYDFKTFTNHITSIKTESDIELVKDMLSISFPNGYSFWYIGRGQSPNANIAKISKNSLLWLFDEEIPNSFSLRSDDEWLDMKLLQMFHLYNKTISASLFAQIDVDK
jgi:hypothetical protein